MLPPAIIGNYLDNTLPTLTPHAVPTLHQKFHYYEKVCWSKLDGVALLITDPPPTSSTTLSSTMQNQYSNKNGKGWL